MDGLYHPHPNSVNAKSLPTPRRGMLHFGCMIDPKTVQAGPALDRVIAERVMGIAYAGPPPPYSTDIAAAWTVAETMIHKNGVYFGCPHFKHKHQNLASLGYPEGTECWYCVINTKRLNKVVLCAETAPLAICRAALLWAVTHGDDT